MPDGRIVLQSVVTYMGEGVVRVHLSCASPFAPITVAASPVDILSGCSQHATCAVMLTRCSPASSFLDVMLHCHDGRRISRRGLGRIDSGSLLPVAEHMLLASCEYRISFQIVFEHSASLLPDLNSLGLHRYAMQSQHEPNSHHALHAPSQNPSFWLGNSFHRLGILYRRVSFPSFCDFSL
jgi:hypothetical protein